MLGKSLYLRLEGGSEARRMENEKQRGRGWLLSRGGEGAARLLHPGGSCRGRGKREGRSAWSLGREEIGGAGASLARPRAPGDGRVPLGSGGGGGKPACAGPLVRRGPQGGEQVPAVERAERRESDLCHSQHHGGLHRPRPGRAPPPVGACVAWGRDSGPLRKAQVLGICLEVTGC